MQLRVRISVLNVKQNVTAAKNYVLVFSKFFIKICVLTGENLSYRKPRSCLYEKIANLW